ncbi:SymE family type I addiction module toxin [Dickeya fangzhongdai]|uniref:SymE family type I addiction module toxin n=1 Tax=Dickeya fangzhongdai TaxID=1778540 RepID=UPI0026E01917|nr:SymE family type I addiction module toxin [Dickeya fangzhongdai]WKV50854.1 SymE family type I addiction module toxin [Dickeya fangzhongdai]
MAVRDDKAIQRISQAERYERARFQAVSLQGAWLTEAGFTDGMPLKIRVMPGCMVITAQNTRELWHCLEGLSIDPLTRTPPPTGSGITPAALSSPSNQHPHPGQRWGFLFYGWGVGAWP